MIVPRAHDVGGFEVHRALPAQEKQMVGPFIFFDQMGPGEFLTGKGLDVRPHPHIGLATVTYLFEGSILHRDSLGTQLPIVPGDVNWMTAGSGIAHSERTDTALRATPTGCSASSPGSRCRRAMEETAPAFAHHEAAALPVLDDGGVRLRLIAGDGWGMRSPVRHIGRCSMPMPRWRPGAVCRCRISTRNAASISLQGAVDVAGTAFEAGRMLLFRAGDAIAVHGRTAGRSAAAAGRRGDGRAAAHLLELRVLIARADRAGQGGLEGEAVRHGRRRRAGVHPAAGAASSVMRTSGP